MGRSFQIVEDKIEEAEFFLDKLHFAGADFASFDFRTAAFYLSAFLSAIRSITFCLQASLNDLPEFPAWYHEKQQQLGTSELARFFLDARNLSQKVGYYPLGGGRMHKTEVGTHVVELYFEREAGDGPKFVPETDVLTACEAQFRQILQIVIDCYKHFQKVIDPEKYYTVENMIEKGFAVEDFEEEMGFERGWTQAEGLNLADRIALIRKSAPRIAIDWIFAKYLGTDRYGTPVNEDSRA